MTAAAGGVGISCWNRAGKDWTGVELAIGMQLVPRSARRGPRSRIVESLADGRWLVEKSNATTRAFAPADLKRVFVPAAAPKAVAT